MLCSWDYFKSDNYLVLAIKQKLCLLVLLIILLCFTLKYLNFARIIKQLLPRVFGKHNYMNSVQNNAPALSSQLAIPNSLKFLFGGLSGMGATCFTHPFDLTKTRMQLTGDKRFKTSFHAMYSVARAEGIFAVYNGISAGFLRQATYTTARLGIYTWMFELFSGQNGKPPDFALKILLGMSAGGIAAIVGIPAEVALIRMMADGRLPPSERRNYKNAINALIRITREEGLLTLTRGTIPTLGRAMSGNAAQLASYSQGKQMMYETGYFSDNIFLHFCASMISGIVTSVVSMPFDIAKTRIQNMKTNAEGKPEYKGTVDVLTKVVRNEGFFALWKGFTPYFGRVGPHTILTFIFLEQLNSWYKRFKST